MSDKRAKWYILSYDPVPLARARFVNRRVWDSQKQLKVNCGIILRNQHDDECLFCGPVRMDITFYFKIPKRVTKKRRVEMEAERTPHIFKPDLDNLIKFLLDVGNNVIYHDDCIIAEIHSRKLYSTNPRTEFLIENI